MLKQIVLATFIAGVYIDPAAAQWFLGSSSSGYNLFGTKDQAVQRQNAERYNEGQRRVSQGYSREPLGGYNQRLGDPAPYGTDQYGYSKPSPSSGYSYGFPTYPYE